MIDLQVSPLPRFQVHFAVSRGCVLGCFRSPLRVSFGCFTGAVWVRAVTPITLWAKARPKLTTPTTLALTWTN